MVNYVNFSTRTLPSVDYGRINVWNRQQQHAIDARNAALSGCCGSSGGNFGLMMPGMPMGFCYPMPVFGFGFPYGFAPGFCSGFGSGFAIGTTIGLGVSLIKQIFSKKSC